jgi:hypothetical protein
MGLSKVELIKDKESGRAPVFKLTFGEEATETTKWQGAQFRSGVSSQWRFGVSRYTAPQGHGEDNYAILSLSGLTKVMNGMTGGGKTEALNALASKSFKAAFAALGKASQAEAKAVATNSRR